MVTRFDDWPNRLSQYLQEKQHQPFQWGVNDCMSFTAGAVYRLTGTDFFTDYSDYYDEISAYNMLRENGGVKGIISRCLGAGKLNPLQAQRGDVVVVKIPEMVGGIVDDSGQRIAVVTPQGLTRLPLEKAVRYWSY